MDFIYVIPFFFFSELWIYLKELREFSKKDLNLKFIMNETKNIK